MGALIRAKDWSKTPVGPVEEWPQSLRTALSIILNSKFPMFLWWGPELVCFYNDAYRPSLGQNGKHPFILGKKAVDAWTEIWHIIKPLIDQVLVEGEAVWREDQLIPIYRNGKIEDVYWTFSYSPLHDESGKVAGVLVTCSETTEKVFTLHLLEESNRRYFNNIMQAPVAMCVLRGKNFVVEIANELMLKLWEKTVDLVMDRPLFDGLPEAKGQGLEQLLEHVYQTGEKVFANERPVTLPRKGKIETTFLNFVYDVLREPDGTISGIVVIAFEVTPQVIARKKVEQSEKRFRNTVDQAPLGITILSGPRFVVEMANKTYLQIVDRKEEEFIGRPLFESLPEVRDTVELLLTAVLTTGVPFQGTEFAVTLNRFGKQELTYFNLVYHPLREDNGDISGVIVVATEVTASVKAKHSLAESERQFRNLVMQSPIPMSIFRGEDYIIEMANSVMFQKIWRKKESDIRGRKLLEVFPELNDQKYPALLKKVFTTGKLHKENESIAYVLGDDGLKKFYFDFQYTPLFETDGEVSGIIVTVNDVTEKVEARKKVEEAEERLRLAAEATELSTWDLDLQTRKIIYSSRLAEIFGHNKSKVLSHAEMRAQIHPDDIHEVVEKAFDVALQTGIYKYEARVVKPNEEICWISTQGKVYFDEEGRPVKMIGTLRDITEEKEHQQEIQESEQKFRLLADSMPQHIWTADPEGNLNYFNQSVYDYSGLTIEQLNNEGWLQIVHPDDRTENKLIWMDSITTGKDFLLEHRFRRHDGEYRWQLSRAIPQKDSTGDIQMWVGTSTDIQDQKIFLNELERLVQARTRELEQKNSDLKKMNAELQSFAYVSSHDLQEPLRKIQTFASRIIDKENQNLSEAGKDYFRRMQEAANRMQTLIQDLLTYSRTNTTERAFKKTDLNEILHEITNDLKETLVEKKAIIAADKMCEASIIPFQFRQLMNNLIGNALKFSKPGNPPYIKVKSEVVKASDLKIESPFPQSKYCHISVSDNGIGFDPQYKDRIFEVFQRLHGKDEYSGTGIGLAIVKKIVENHNGVIKATGELNKGATFDIYIPAS